MATNLAHDPGHRRHGPFNMAIKITDTRRDVLKSERRDLSRPRAASAYQAEGNPDPCSIGVRKGKTPNPSMFGISSLGRIKGMMGSPSWSYYDEPTIRPLETNPHNILTYGNR
jgi:hypothetical protein